MSVNFNMKDRFATYPDWWKVTFLHCKEIDHMTLCLPSFSHYPPTTTTTTNPHTHTHTRTRHLLVTWAGLWQQSTRTSERARKTYFLIPPVLCVLTHKVIHTIRKALGCMVGLIWKLDYDCECVEMKMHRFQWTIYLRDGWDQSQWVMEKWRLSMSLDKKTRINNRGVWREKMIHFPSPPPFSLK